MTFEMELPDALWDSLGVRRLREVRLRVHEAQRVRRRLFVSSTPEFLLPIAAAIARSLGDVPVDSVSVTILEGRQLNVEVKPTQNNGGVASGGTPAATVSITDLTAAVSSPGFATSLSAALVDQGFPAVDFAGLISEPKVETTLATAPSPPPPSFPPLPPSPIAPAQQLLSHSTTGQDESVAEERPTGNTQSNYTLWWLIALTIVAVFFVCILPLLLIFFAAWLYKRYRKAAKMDPLTLTNIVSVNEAPLADDESAEDFERAAFGQSCNQTWRGSLFAGTVVTAAGASGRSGSAAQLGSAYEAPIEPASATPVNLPSPLPDAGLTEAATAPGPVRERATLTL